MRFSRDPYCAFRPTSQMRQARAVRTYGLRCLVISMSAEEELTERGIERPAPRARHRVRRWHSGPPCKRAKTISDARGRGPFGGPWGCIVSSPDTAAYSNPVPAEGESDDHRI
jgi:hypothetical protein